MKGLLVKDFRFILGQKSSLLIAVGLGLYFLATGTDMSFAFIFTMMLACILATSSISYDNMDNGMSFMMTLPIQKKTYVVSKYILSVAVVLLLGAVVLLMAVIGSNMEMFKWTLGDLKGALLVAGAFATVMMAVMIPVYIIFGAEKARIAIMAIYGICAVVIFVLKSAVKDAAAIVNEVMAELLALSSLQLALLGVGAMVALLVISMIISMIGLEKKEY